MVAPGWSQLRQYQHMQHQGTADLLWVRML